METIENVKVNAWSVQSVIDAVENIVSPWWKHNMDDIYGDRGGIPYPALEELSYLHFKLDSKVKIQQTKEECEQMLNKIKQLGISQVEIIKIMGIGKFLVIEMTNKVLVDSFNNFEQFIRNNEEKINQMYESVDKQVPKEFIAYRLFYTEK